MDDRRHASKEETKTCSRVSHCHESRKTICFSDSIGTLYSWYFARRTVFISAKEGYGMRQLLQATEKRLLSAGFLPNTQTDKEEYVAKISILGRPNAGKSTLVNTLSGQEISIVSPIAGTTRDNVDSVIAFEKSSICSSTPLVFEKSKMHRENLERFSRLRAISALSRADVAILLIDATEGITHQDQTIASELTEAGVGVMIAFQNGIFGEK